jgi:hypothetical protein
MNPWITNFLLQVISSHKSGVGARKASQWARLRFISVVCANGHLFSSCLTIFQAWHQKQKPLDKKNHVKVWLFRHGLVLSNLGLAEKLVADHISTKQISLLCFLTLADPNKCLLQLLKPNVNACYTAGQSIMVWDCHANRGHPRSSAYTSCKISTSFLSVLKCF